jgi:hypothetical protein
MTVDRSTKRIRTLSLEALSVSLVITLVVHLAGAAGATYAGTRRDAKEPNSRARVRGCDRVASPVSVGRDLSVEVTSACCDDVLGDFMGSDLLLEDILDDFIGVDLLFDADLDEFTWDDESSHELEMTEPRPPAHGDRRDAPSAVSRSSGSRRPD